MDTRIYVMTHKKIAEIPNDIYIPLHVGRAGKEGLGYLGDDTGENISEKNASYCELTGMYWLWKNVDCDIIGICHYRRYFLKDGQILDQTYIEQSIQKYPVIIPDSRCVKGDSVYEHYIEFHDSDKDLVICREVIAEKYPDYLPAFDFCMQTILFSIANMWITRKDIYDRYCSWLFSILFEAEKRIDTTGYNDYQIRVMGFLAERLFRVWLFMQPEAITEENIEMIDPVDFGNIEKRAALLYRYTKLKITPVLNLYTSGATAASLAQPFSCADDFEGKVPVWVCWWQGETQMPDLVRCCIDSIKRNLPQHKAVFRLLTLENCMEYVTFTETVICKFNEGKISFAHLSSLLRAELLYRYGGMWIDADYYVARQLPVALFEKGFYTLRFQDPSQQFCAANGKWLHGFWCAKKGHRLFQFLMEGLWYYWEVEEGQENEYLADHLIGMAVEAFNDIRESLESCGYASEKVFALHKMMDCRYTQERAQFLQEGEMVYQLDWKAEYQKENMAKEQTVFGYLSAIGLP